MRRALGTGDATLLSLFIDSNGEPRAAIGYGDLETSDMVVTVTHGIETDVEQIRAWAAATTQDVRRDVGMGDETARDARRRRVCRLLRLGLRSGAR